MKLALAARATLTVHASVVQEGPARNSDTSLFRRLNGPKYFPLDRHDTMPTVQCSENRTHWSDGLMRLLFEKSDKRPFGPMGYVFVTLTRRQCGMSI